jgi:catechol 2,3-dioxygenase-like lactoylglutathione lyase family enzyme/predicted metal-dependent enzyme (double-stranded beta helix superfamily)
MNRTATDIRSLNHVAYRCRDAAETAAFYTGVLGLRLAHVIVQDRVPSTQEFAPHCHLFFELGDGSWVAFFDLADEDMVSQQTHPDWAQHLALEVESLEILDRRHRALTDHGVEVLGPVDHGFIRSIYFRDPSGHRLELACRTHTADELQAFATVAAVELDAWSTRKALHRSTIDRTGVARERTDAIAQTMTDIRALEERHGVTRDGVAAIRDRLLELAARTELFSSEEFPSPTEGRKGCLYRLSEDDDRRFALYLNSSGGAVATPPHDHTTWAVVVGFEGQELNRFYRRSAEGGVEQVGQAIVEAGTGVAMLPEDLHSIHIEGPALNFHCYGLALEHLPGRQYYSNSGDWKTFPANSDIREARLDRVP